MEAFRLAFAGDRFPGKGFVMQGLMLALLAFLGLAATSGLENFDAKSQASVAFAYAAQLPADPMPAPLPDNGSKPVAGMPAPLMTNAPACAGGKCQLPAKGQNVKEPATQSRGRFRVIRCRRCR